MNTERKRPTLDLTGFTPAAAPKPTPPREEIESLAEQSGFASRTPVPRNDSTESISSLVPKPASRSVKMARLSLEVSAGLRKALQERAHSSEFGTVRAVILDALKAKGFPVDQDELLDRRTLR